jgi:hypothetical protein
MRAQPGTGYGKGSPYYAGPGSTPAPYVSTDPNGHDHFPARDVLVDFADALLHPPPGHTPIYVHFDAGDAGYVSPAAHPTLFVPPGLARGGESVVEEECAGNFPECRFPGYAGLVSFPSGLHFLGLAAVDDDTGDVITNPNDPNDPSSAWCQIQSQDPAVKLDDCRRLFDLNRDGIFHLLFFAHARGTPRSSDPCLVTVDGNLIPGPATGIGPDGVPVCAEQHNPDHYLVKSVSGVSQLSGWLHLVTLGLWDNFTGTERMQTQTAMHEFLHGLGIWHGGRAPEFTPLPDGRVHISVRPNCNPYYFSVANYIYQATGVANGSGGLFSRPSGENSGSIDEQSLTDGLFGLPFRASWYAPLVEGTVGDRFGLVPATRHCDGTPLLGDVDTVRLDATLAPSLNWNIDWNGDGTGTAPPQDVNFDGKEQSALGGGAPLQGFNDWEGMSPNRLGTGPNMAGFSVGLGLDFGGLDFGGLDFGGLDFGGLDFGGLDFGGLDFGGLDFGGLDFGGLDFGGLDFGGLDFGGLDFGGLDFGGLEDEIRAELTYEIVTESIAPGGSTAPNNLTACVIGGTGTGPNCAEGSVPLHRHRLNWEAPTVGSPDFYKGWRVWDPTGLADVPDPDSVVSDVGTTPDAATTTLDDNEELPDGQRFIYWVRASVNGKFGSLSNFAIVTAENTAPVANDDLGPLYSIPAGSPGANFPSVLANDTDVDSSPSSLRAVLVTGPLHGTLVLNTDGTFFYSPAPGFIGADTFTSPATNGTWTQGGSSVPKSANSTTATVTIAVTQPPTSPATFQSTDVCFYCCW